MPSAQPSVTCLDCHFGWNSNSMAEGLRLLGSCPRCGGELEFHERAPVAAPDAAVAPPLIRI